MNDTGLHQYTLDLFERNRVAPHGCQGQSNVSFETVMNWKLNFKWFETFNQILLSYSEAVICLLANFWPIQAEKGIILSQVHHFLIQNSSNSWKNVLRIPCYNNMQQF